MRILKKLAIYRKAYAFSRKILTKNVIFIHFFHIIHPTAEELHGKLNIRI